jgi:predicted metal-dependent HD superfamily phosphohydrolase
MLETTFIELLTKYTNDNDLISELWDEVESNYSNKKRYYHTLEHLENLFAQLVEIKEK